MKKKQRAAVKKRASRANARLRQEEAVPFVVIPVIGTAGWVDVPVQDAASPIEGDPPRPCDDYIDDPTAPAVLRTFLAFARAPAHGQLLPRPHPRLFADHEGRRVRVTMASRFGDVGITTNHGAEAGYDRRVAVSQLDNFSEDP